jgi:hypothetical protein
MVTTIQMHEDIIKELNALKKELNLKSCQSPCPKEQGLSCEG